MVALVAAVLLMGQGEETPEQRVARLQRVPAADLARSYLANEYTLTMIGMARQGATVHLEGGLVVTAANADSAAAEYQHRQDVYAAVMRARGSRPLAAAYVMRLKKPCDESGFFAVRPRQDGFRVTLRLRHDLGEDELSGIVVEDALVLQGDDPGDLPTGRVRGREDQIELATRSGRCAMILAGGEVAAPPVARLEQPDSVIGTWEGKWDGQFGVRFTISRAGEAFEVAYEWQEYEGGAFAADTFRAFPTSARGLRSEFGTFELSFDGPSGSAVGHFGPRTRRTRLLRTVS